MANWIIEETQFQNDFDVAQRLMYLLEEKGLPYTSFKYKPFGQTDYSFLPKSPAIFYGTWNALADMRERVDAQKLPKPLAWCDWELFKCSTYYEKLKPYILQQGYTFSCLQDIPNLQADEDSLFFRPDDNEKSFVGQVVEKHFWKTWPKHLMEYKYLAGKLSIVYAPVKQIDMEWRLVIVDKKVIAGSQYKFDIQEGYPVECREFAERVANHWSPHPVYIMDIGLSEEKYWVIEIGPFNYAGLYKCDLNKIVDSIEHLQV